MYEQKINGKHIPCVFSPGLCNANSYVFKKKYPDTKTQAYRGDGHHHFAESSMKVRELGMATVAEYL